MDILREWWSYAGEPLCSSASEEQRRRGWCVSPDIGLAACEGQGRKGRAEIAPDCHVAGSVSIAIEFTCSAAPLTPVYIYSSSPRAFTLSRCAQHWSDQGSLNEHIATPAALASRRERPMRHAMRTLHENPTHAPLTSAHARRFPPRRLAHVGCVSYPRVGIVTLGATACTAITESPRLTRDSVKLFARSALPLSRRRRGACRREHAAARPWQAVHPPPLRRVPLPTTDDGALGGDRGREWHLERVARGGGAARARRRRLLVERGASL